MIEKLNENIVTQLIINSDYQTASDLANILGVNEKTIRRRIKQINELLTNEIGEIESKVGRGYKLQVFNKEKFYRYYDYYISEIELSNPINRRTMLFEYIYQNRGCTKETLFEEFFISDTTLTNDIKELNENTKRVNVKIKYSKQRYSLVGNEYYIRNSLLRLNYDSSMAGAKRRDTREFKNKVVQIIVSILKDNCIHVNKNGLDAIVNFTIISISNLLNGGILDISSFVNDVKISTYFIDIANDIYSSIGRVSNILFPYNEIVFLSYFLRAVLPLSIEEIVNEKDTCYLDAVKHTQETQKFLMEIGFERFSVEFHNDLIKFFYGFNMRVLLDIQKRELDYFDVEITHNQAYFIAKLAMKELFKNELSISRDEIAHLALLVQKNYFIEKKKQNKTLAVLPSDETFAQIYRYELRLFVDLDIEVMEYKDYVGENTVSFSEYDLIIGPFHNLPNDSLHDVYATRDFFTKADLLKISRMVSFKDYSS